MARFFRLRYLHPALTSLFVSLLLLGASIALAQAPVDSDHDGLSDQQEQALLEKFRPTFRISPTDCAVRPASFTPDQEVPQPAAADGTIYG